MADLHPEAEALRQARLDNRIPDIHTLTPAEAREGMRRAREAAGIVPELVGEVSDFVTEGDRSQPLKLRLYRPDTARVLGDLPTLIFFHGGGWVTGDLESHDQLCRQLTNASGCAIIAVDYRLAPENRFPAALDDARYACMWVHQNAKRINADADRISVGGDSAGANLATVCAILARDGGLPPVLFQFLLYPCVDLRCGHASHSLSMRGLPVVGASMLWFRDHYIGSREEAKNWQVSPLLAPDLEGVAPAYLLTAGHDPLADEGRAYAAKLEASDVSVIYEHKDDQFHGFLTIGATLPSVLREIQRIGALLAKSLATKETHKGSATASPT